MTTTPLNINGISEIDFTNGVSAVTVTNDVASITFASSGGTVTHTGALTSGQLIKGNGADDITVGDLTGDVTTSGTLGTTLAKIQTKTLTITSPAANDILTYNGTSWVNGTISSLPNANASQIQSVNVSTVTPQTGDTLRYNEYGDSKWDVTTGVPNFYKIQAAIVAASLLSVPADTATVTTAGTASNIAATATETSLCQFIGAATASTSVVAYVFGPETSNSARLAFGPMRRFSARVKLTQTTNARYWLGLTAIDASTFSTGLATNTPNYNYAMFRYSNGTDTNIQAVCATDNTHQTVVDTGVAMSTTTTKLFEIAYDGSNVNFYIDGVRVAQISTNVMATSTLVTLLCSADNKNNNTAVGFQYAYAQVTMK